MVSKVMGKGIELNQLLGKLNKLVPLRLAESWDNVSALTVHSEVANLQVAVVKLQLGVFKIGNLSRSLKFFNSEGSTRIDLKIW